jgi:uncharacterized membrane protein YphA (DoxX/SURF4 family)
LTSASFPHDFYLDIGARWIVGVVLLVAGTAKLPSLSAFGRIIASYEILPTALIRPVALVLPVGELLLGLALLTGIESRIAAAIGALLFLSFGVALTRSLIRGDRMLCGCFGTDSLSRAGPMSVVRDAALFALSMAVLASPHTYLSVLSLGDPGVWNGSALADALPILLMSTGVVTLYMLGGSLLNMHGGERR